MITHIHRQISYSDLFTYQAQCVQMAWVALLWHVPQKQRLHSRWYCFYRTLMFISVFNSLSLSGFKTLACHCHGNRESPTCCQGNRSKNMIFFFWQQVWESFPAMLLCSKCERGYTSVCVCLCVWLSVFPVVAFGRESSDLAESANLLQEFTWPCLQPRPCLFCPSGSPVSASRSWAPATHNMAPGKGQWGECYKELKRK